MTKDAISLYAAGLSSIVFVWQLWRAWLDRQRITTSYVLRGIDDPGNEIILINNAPKPVTVYHIELFWGRRMFGWTCRYVRVGTGMFGVDDDADTGITIDPFKMVTLRYDEDRHFGWPYRRRPQARLYIRFNTVGRGRATTLLIYRPYGALRGLIDGLGQQLGIGRYLDEPRGDPLLELGE